PAPCVRHPLRMNDEGRPEPPFARLLVDRSPCRLCRRGCLAPLAVAAAAAAASPTPLAVTARPFLRPLARRRVLRPLDQLLRRDRVAVLVLQDQLQADAPARLVDLLHDHVE